MQNLQNPKISLTNAHNTKNQFLLYKSLKKGVTEIHSTRSNSSFQQTRTPSYHFTTTSKAVNKSFWDVSDPLKSKKPTVNDFRIVNMSEYDPRDGIRKVKSKSKLKKVRVHSENIEGIPVT